MGSQSELHARAHLESEYPIKSLTSSQPLLLNIINTVAPISSTLLCCKGSLALLLKI